MPRTKQVHPKNLRDKIEEAQKELNPGESSKEISEAGIRGNLDTVKALKRKKIVTENYMKKIPKSPLRNPSSTKFKHCIKESSSPYLPSNISECSKNLNHLTEQNGEEYAKQNGGVCKTVLTVETFKTGAPVQTKEVVLHQSLKFCNGKGKDYDSSNKMTLQEDKCISSSFSNKSKTDSGEISDNSTSLCASTAFDVLLKAMEPELNTLVQKCHPCGAQLEKQRPNETLGPFSSFTSTTKSVQNPASLSQQEFTVGPQCYPCSVHNIQLSTFAMDEQVHSDSACHSYSHQELSHTGHHNQQLALNPSMVRSLVHQQYQDNRKLQQIYNISVTSSVGHTSCSNLTQVLPHNQLTANASPPVSVSPTNTTQLPPAPLYNITHVASLVNQGGEQMCNLLLKDQKTKKQGKYICEYCNRACAKPSVLLKHIRSHTGERPYPCVTCGFSFKTKSNLYKHKKSHAHAIKLGLVLRPHSGDQESEKSLCIHCDVDESGESDDEYTSEERQDEQSLLELETMKTLKIMPPSESVLQKSSPVSSENLDHTVCESSLQETCSESTVSTTLPKVVVYPVNVSPLRNDSPKDSTSELDIIQKQENFRSSNRKSNFISITSLREADLQQKEEMTQLKEKQEDHVITIHAQLQRQQATDCPQDQQGKYLLSPRSLGSTDSGYFSRSESADQMSQQAPIVKVLSSCEKDFSKNPISVSQISTAMASVVHTICSEKPLIPPGTMRPPLGTKTLEERISKLISDNEAVVDDKQLDSVKPRRISLSRRGSIDSPKSYIFKDSFQFDLKPVGRRTSSSSDIPKSPFTPTDKSKQVFFLSVPSLDCLPITRSNSMPTTGYSAIPTNIIPPHPLRESQSFDDKIGSFYDDVFVSAPTTALHQVGHPRTLVRQKAIEDSPSNDNHSLGSAHSVDESYHGGNVLTDISLPRSKSFAQGSNSEKIKKSHQGRGTMFECETCRNRYRKLENFENHKKFYCSELHGPKSKAAVREPEQNVIPNSTQPQVMHYRVAGSTGILEQPPQIRKRRKMKSVGDDDEPQQNHNSVSLENMIGAHVQNILGSSLSSSNHSVSKITSQQPSGIPLQSSQTELVSRGTEQSSELKLSPILEKTNLVCQEKEMKRQGSGISVIQHTNSLSRPNSFEKSESFERGSPVSFQDIQKTPKHQSFNTAGVIQEEGYSQCSQYKQPISSEDPQLEVKESQSLVPNERSGPVHQSRLVRQHNIQVPEILVTEEPDRDPENQGNDQDIIEKFNWPQRSESLSNLPTEKLPPKKKRIRLAEIEHSSTDSSFDSTLSRSLSRDSSLSRTSSISASFDKDDVSKTESISKVDGIIKSYEFFMIPTGSNSLGVPREMRRAASEQINCTHSSMEVADCRSKSLDCGSMSPTDCMAAFEVLTPKSSLCTEISGHVPLLERRRGPFVRQISLNIVPENNVHQAKSAQTFQKTHLADLSNVSFHRLKTSARSSDELSSDSQLSSYAKTLPESQLVTHTSNPSSVQQPLCSGLASLCQQQLLYSNKKACVKVLNKEEEQGTSSVSSENESCFAPKYQLQVKTQQISQSYSSKQLTITLPNRNLPGQGSMEQNSVSLNMPTQLVDNKLGLHSVPQSKKLLHSNSSDQMQQITPFIVPVHSYINTAAYDFAGVKTLPQILVTKDQANPPVCKVNNAPIPPSKDKTQIKSNEENNRAMPNTEKAIACENNFSRTECRNSEPLNFIQKIPVGGLLPHQEATASSKRMLSPANSLDIAMEKHQKRVKDESGAACTSDVQAAHLLNVKSGDSNKQKKHVLVRQLCTTEPIESIDQETVPEYRKNSKMVSFTNVLQSDILSSEGFKPVVPESIEEATEFETIKSLTSSDSTVGKSPEPLSVNTQSSLLEASSTNQEQRSPEIANLKQLNIQSHVKVGPTLSVVNAGDMHRLSFPSLKTSTSFTWCYLLKRRPLHMLQIDQKISAYSAWTVSPSNPNPLGLPTKVALSLLNSKQKDENSLYTRAISTRSRCDILVYSSKWKNDTNKLLVDQKSTVKGDIDKENSETSTEQDKDNIQIRNEPRRVKYSMEGKYKSNEDYVYVRGRGRGKYICEECGIRCKKPSMLKKHIRTHTDVRPYHCNYCNFSFKTKGNLTKHMKSKAHSKKCVDMGVSVGPIDEQDAEELGERQKYGCERPGYDLDESDGPDDDDNEDEDEDSQAESGLSTTPSVTASPQHHPDRSSHHETSNASEETRISDCFPRGQAGLLNILPKALLTKMTALTTASNCRTARSPLANRHQDTHDNSVLQHVTSMDCPQASSASSRSPSYQMSVDYPDTQEALEGSLNSEATVITKDSSVKLPSPPVDRSTQTSSVSDYEFHQQKRLQTTDLAASQTHLFSHLPLHSQQPARTPYNMIPIGGVQLVPTYSTFVPIQAGPVQLTIPAVSVIHRPTGALSDNLSEIPSTTNPIGIAEVNSVVPCIPVGQVGASSLQPLPALSMETLNILGLANTNVTPQIHPSGLKLNAVGLQVLTTSPSQSNPNPQTHIPGLQILNIALPTLIPSISPLSTDGQGVPEPLAFSKKACETHPEQMPVSFPIGHSNQNNRTGSPQITPSVQEYSGKKISDPAVLHEYKRLNVQEKADAMNHMKLQSNVSSVLGKATYTPKPFLKTNCGGAISPLIQETRSADIQAQRLGLPQRQNTVQFSDASSDDDEDRLVIAT
ncbi:zinc finger protein 40 [Rhinatrema bivittatum]|uniref:zinc finger protein 40 n=1 Tax=Rhinatrema bivittatum TaxID=194408 RepID=UPI00112D38BB|nr:zinc finger protein 40 [Rhinatrema bivittatum]